MKIKTIYGCAIIAAAYLFLCSSNVSAQESVDSSELQRAAGPVEFISNTALPDRIDTRDQILQLGQGPGSAVRAGAERYGAQNRYFVIHRLYPPEFDKLDADIFGLGTATAVDTIGNLRLIIQGYLQNAYNYSAADAVLLAEYITIYNAVYRQNRAYFTQRYKTPLLGDLTPGSEGIALNYRDWPGKTLMLIPLMSAANGSLSAIDTTAITDNAVINKMREDSDKGIDSRQAMVNLKEREADAAELAAAQQRQANTAEERRLAEEQKQLAGEKTQLDAARQSATPAETAALEQKAAELAARETNLAKQAEDLEKNKEAARQTQEFAERKAVEAQRDREKIAADQREIITGAAQTTAPAAQSGVLAVRLSSAATPRGTIIKINPDTGTTLQSSALDQVAARTVTVTGGKTIAAANSSGKTRLIEVDPQTLQSVKQGSDDLNPDTLIWAAGTNLYALVVAGGKNYLARFDINLTKQAQSERAVHPWAALNFQGDKIITQSDSGAVIILNSNNLTE